MNHQHQQMILLQPSIKAENQKASAGKTPQDDDIDRLSALPDDVLHHIMSFLHIKHAAASSILSTRWRKLFTSLPDINLQIWGIRNPHIANDVDYRKLWGEINIGYQVLVLRNRAPIRKFQLRVHLYVERFGFTIESLISSALLCMVQELDVSVAMKHNICLISPQIFACKTLISLKLSSDVDLVNVLPNSVSLPNLKVLHLRGDMRVVDGTCIGKIMKGCPLLEELCLVLSRSDKCTKDEVVDFSSPYLKKLILTSSNFGGRFDFIVKSDKLEYLDFNFSGKNGVALDAPNLNYLNYKGKPGHVNFKLTQSLKSHVRATMAIRYRFAEICGKNSSKSLLLGSQQALELINVLQSVQSLYLCEHSLLALHFSGKRLPTFTNLTTLHLEVSFTGFDHSYFWTTLQRLLESAPNLAVLIFSEVYNDASPHVDSIPRACIPICFNNHLKEIEIKVFTGAEYEFELVKYILILGKSLKKMTIGAVIGSSKSLHDYSDRIMSFQKRSKDCQIVINQ